MTLFDPVPQILIDNAQLWHRRPDPLAFRIEARHALAGLRVLDESLAVTNQHADIRFVVEYADPTIPVAVDRALRPTFTLWSRKSFLVEPQSNGIG